MNIRLRPIGSVAKQRGVATVELAVSIPMLLIIMLVTVEFSRVFYQYNTLTKSVRDGSRYLAQNALSGSVLQSIPGGTLTETRNLVVSGSPGGGSALLAGLSAGDVDITFDSIIDGGLPRHYVKVSVSYQFQPLAPLLNGLGFLSSGSDLGFQLNAQSSMRAH